MCIIYKSKQTKNATKFKVYEKFIIKLKIHFAKEIFTYIYLYYKVVKFVYL